MENNSIEDISAGAAGSAEVSKKTKSLDLQSLYKTKISKEGPTKKGNSAEQNGDEDRGNNKKRKKRNSGKEVALDSLQPVGKKSRKSLNDGHFNDVGYGSDVCRSSSGLSQKNELNGISLSLAGNGNDIRVPKRPRGSVRRKKLEDEGKKLEDDGLAKVTGSSSSVHQVDRLNGELRKVDSSGSSGAEAVSNDRRIGLPGSAGHAGCSKVKQKRVLDEVKESRNGRVNSARRAKEEDRHAVENNGEVSSRKCRSNLRKRKDLASGIGTVVKKVEPSVDNSSSLSDGFQDDDNDEENLEQNAARMLSSRFDPRCTGFSSKSRSFGRQSDNDLSFAVSSDRDFAGRGVDSSAGLRSTDADAASRVLRPRKQHKEKGLSRKRRHFYEVVASNLDAYWIVDQRIKVFWPLDEIWYHGLVNDYDPERNLHHVKYDDRDEEWIDLQNEKFKLLLLPSEVPGKGKSKIDSMGDNYVDNGKTDFSEDDDSYAGNYLDSEPIISWLARSSRRVISTPCSSLKKQKTLQLSPSMLPPLLPVKTDDRNGDVSLGEDGSKSDRGVALLDRLNDDEKVKNSDCGLEFPERSTNGERVESSDHGFALLDRSNDGERVENSDCGFALPTGSTDGEMVENSLQGNPSSSKAGISIFYVRRHLRKKSWVLSPFCENGKAYRSPLGTFTSSDPAVDSLQTSKQYYSPLRFLDTDKLLWSIDDQGLLRLRMPLIESKRFMFDTCLPVLPFLKYSFRVDQFWLSHVSLLPHYGTLMTTWPEIVLEMLFVDNTVGLRFLLFEGSLKKSVALFSLILTVFNQPQEEWKFFDVQLPITSIRFKFSSIQDLRKQQVFAFYSFSKLRHSKWLYLDSKLQRHCVLTKQLPLSDCTHDNLKSLEGGSYEFLSPHGARGSSHLKKSSMRGILPVGVSREYGTIRRTQSTCSSSVIGKFPMFALSFAAAPTFFLGLHLKLLMEHSFACIGLQDSTSMGSFEDSEVENQLISLDSLEGDSCTEKAPSIIPESYMGDSLAQTTSEFMSFAVPDSGMNSGSVACTDERTQGTQYLENGKLDISVNLSCSNNLEVNEIDRNVHTQKCKSDDSEQFVTSPSPSVSKTVESSGLTNTQNYSGLGGMSIEFPSFVRNDKPFNVGMNVSGQASDLSGNVSDGSAQSLYPTGRRSSWRRDRNGSNSSSFGDLSPVWPAGKSSFIRNGFGNGPRKPRTQVQYTLPSGGYDISSNHKNLSQRSLPYKRIRRSKEKRISDSLRGFKKNLEMLACDANVLVTLRDKGWRECGAHVVLELTDHNEWRLAVKVSGVTKYSHKVNQILQPGSTNRYTHAMMWKGGKDWVLEFPDRSKWILFKEMYEECHNRNIRAASVKNIPIPGVCLIEEGDDYAADIHFLRNSPKYFRQVEGDVEMALDPSNVLYDMDSDDEQWIIENGKSLCTGEKKVEEISDELFEKTMDMIEKVAYSQQRDNFTVDELEELMVGIDSIELLKAIYEHWRQKKQRKGMPLIRHFQPPMWERYQQQVKEWEVTVARSNDGPSSVCKEKTVSTEKPPMFAFCLKPRGLEVPNRGSKQRSQKRFPVSGHNQALSGEQDGLYTYGRRLNGFADDKTVHSGRSHEFSDASPLLHHSTRVFSPRDAGRVGYFSASSDVSEWSHYPKFQRNKLKKNGMLPSPNNSQLVASYNQRTTGMRNGVQRWNMDLPEWPSQKHYHHEVYHQRHVIEQLDGSDRHEFRLRDASSAAQHALNMAKLKREKAQRLLYRADLAIHKAVVALMTAEAIKAAFDSTNGDG